MDWLDQGELKRLIRRQEGWCVSIYLPTHRKFPEVKQDPIRFKNLLRRAEDRLKEGGLRSSEAKKLLKPAKALITDTFFWRNQSDGLAVFVSPEGFIRYRLPLEFDELLVVTDRFHIKPLLPLFVYEGRFFVLALSQNEIKFFHCTRHSVTEVNVAGVPKSQADALKYDEPERQLQFHTQRQRAEAEGEWSPIFHGHGVGTDDAKVNILRFFQKVDRGLHVSLRTEKVPLLLAGVEYLFPIYREASTYANLMEEGIAGNPEGLKPEELRNGAWKIVAPNFLRAQEEAMAQYRERAGTGRTSKSVEEVVSSAYDGRVDFLFVAKDTQLWGVFDPEARTIRVHDGPEPGDEDLLDLAAVHTFLNGGTVYALKPEEIPDGGPLAALFRY